MIKNLLLSYKRMTKKYKELGKDYQYPYFFKICKGVQCLYFLGVSHIYGNPKDEQIPRIKKYWQEFLKETKKSGKVVFTESDVSKYRKSTLTALIKDLGETGLVSLLAAKENIPVICPEPERRWEWDELLKYFPKEDIVYYYFARTVHQWNKFKKKPAGFNDYLNEHLQRDRETSTWGDFDFSLENLIKIHDKKYNHKFDLKRCRKCVYDESNPATGKVAGICSTLRNEHLVTKIKEEWDKGKSIFVVYGSGHAIVCEPALKELLN